MKRIVILALLAAGGCGEPQPVRPVATTPPAPGEPARPFAPAHDKGEWEPPALKELRKPQPAKSDPR